MGDFIIPPPLYKRVHTHHTHSSHRTTPTSTSHPQMSPSIPTKKCKFSADTLIHPIPPPPTLDSPELLLLLSSPPQQQQQRPNRLPLDPLHFTRNLTMKSGTPSSSSDEGFYSPSSQSSFTLESSLNSSSTSPTLSSSEEEDTTTTPFTVTATLNIGQLFPELLSYIFSFLETKDKARIAQTCSYFTNILRNKQIWKGTVARLNLRPNQGHTYHSMLERGVARVQVLSLKRSLRELTTHIKVTHLKLSGCYNVTDSSLNSMQILVSLVELDLSLCKQITDAGLVHILCKAPNLQRLDLGGCCNLTDRAPLLISYGLRSLKSLDLRSCYNLTDKALSYLVGDVYLSDRHEIKTYNFLARIGLIDLDCELCRRPGAASSKNRIELVKINEHTEFGMISLESLVLQDCQKISDLSLQFIGRLKHLRSLNLSFCVNITDNGLKHLSSVGGTLRELNLRSCDNISDTGLINLRECGALEMLDVSFCEKISTLNVSLCKYLRVLSLSACDVGDEALLREGLELEELQVLNLGQCAKISDKGLIAISEKCKRLKYIDLYGCGGITTVGLDVLMKIQGLKRINLGLWKI